jgi:sentrin-specific protease 1
VEGKEGVVHEYWCQNRLVPFKTVATPGLFMGRRERKKAPSKTQNKYTGRDILYVVRERRELFEFAQKINKRREAVRKHVCAKKLLLRSREEAMKLMQPLMAKERSVVVGATKSIGLPSEILVRASSASHKGRGDSVQRESMQILHPGKWLNDEVINYFLKNCLARRDEKLCTNEPGRRRSHFFNSFFVQNLFDLNNKSRNLRGIYNYNNITRWSRMVPMQRDIFKLKYIFCPINHNNKHWTLAVIFMEAKKIQYYDLCGGTDRAKMEGLLKYVKKEYREKHGKEMDATEWELVSCKRDTP